MTEAVILAGGRASRMGGQDKGLVQFAGKAMISHALERISPQVSRLVINANRNLATYAALGFDVITDENPDFLGPLAGMLAALEQTRSETLLVVPCDCPWLPLDLVPRMTATLLQSQAELVVASDGEREQPVVLLLTPQLLPSIRTYLASGGRKLSQWYLGHKFSVCAFTQDPNAFTNINTRDQLTHLATRNTKI